MDVLRCLGVDFYIMHFPIHLSHSLRLMYMYSVILNRMVVCVCFIFCCHVATFKAINTCTMQHFRVP